MKRPVVTLKSIRALKPCQKQYRLLRKAFPDGVPLTVASAKRLARLDVSFVWYGVRALCGEQYQEFSEASHAADLTYMLETGQMYREYRNAAAIGTDRDCYAAWRKYDLATAPFRERQRFAEAKALLALLLKEHKRNGAKP